MFYFLFLFLFSQKKKNRINKNVKRALKKNRVIYKIKFILMSSIKREEKPSSSNDSKNNIEVMLRQFGNLLQQTKERIERFEARMAEIEKRQQPRGRDRRRNDEGEYKEVDGDGFDEDDE